jgi:predicted transcriptional regulator
MSETLSIRLDSGREEVIGCLGEPVEALEVVSCGWAIAAYVDAEDWQLEEIGKGIKELDSGQTVSHETVSKWLRSWGKPGEGKAPR